VHIIEGKIVAWENTHIHQTEHICNRGISPRDWLYKNYKNEDSAIKHCSSDLYIISKSLSKF